MFTDYELDWSRVPEWANWVAQDADGSVYAFEREPIRRGKVWSYAGADQTPWALRAGRPNPNWQTSCVLRPVTTFDTANPGLVPFKDLPESTQLTYVRAFLAGRLQALAGRTHADEWFECMSLQPGAIVRIAPPITKPSIDWPHVASEYRYLSRDENGGACLWTHKPRVHGTVWWVWGNSSVWANRCADAFASYTPGSCDWKDSLVERPEDQ